MARCLKFALKYSRNPRIEGDMSEPNLPTAGRLREVDGACREGHYPTTLALGMFEIFHSTNILELPLKCAELWWPHRPSVLTQIQEESKGWRGGRKSRREWRSGRAQHSWWRGLHPMKMNTPAQNAVSIFKSAQVIVLPGSILAREPCETMILPYYFLDKYVFCRRSTCLILRITTPRAHISRRLRGRKIFKWGFENVALTALALISLERRMLEFHTGVEGTRCPPTSPKGPHPFWCWESCTSERAGPAEVLWALKSPGHRGKGSCCHRRCWRLCCPYGFIMNISFARVIHF